MRDRDSEGLGIEMQEGQNDWHRVAEISKAETEVKERTEGKSHVQAAIGGGGEGQKNGFQYMATEG